MTKPCKKNPASKELIDELLLNIVSLYREPTEDWKAKIQQAESEATLERNQRLEKERELSRYTGYTFDISVHYELPRFKLLGVKFISFSGCDMR